MKSARQQAIVDLVQTRTIHSEDELRHFLERLGHYCASGSVSRDIKQLALIKVPLHDDTRSAHFKYVLPGNGARYPSQLHRIVAELVDTVMGVENLIVVKTPPGSANMVAAELDRAAWPQMIGTIAGDDTVLAVCTAKVHVPKLLQRFKEMKPKKGRSW
jgi:transcriptional regulator of arginine metabolism